MRVCRIMTSPHHDQPGQTHRTLWNQPLEGARWLLLAHANGCLRLSGVPHIALISCG